MPEIKNVSKNYTDEFGFTVKLLKDISLTVNKGSICSIIAPSGSGKSSLLKIISDLEEATSGEIILHEDEKVIYLPSEPSSFPWLNVVENVMFGLNGMDQTDSKELLKLVSLEGYENHFPNNKSLGFRFRIALARSLARKPSNIVIDEPFNKMDELTKSEVYELIRKINSSAGTSFLFATTNISEAVFLSDKIYLMKKNPGEIFESIEVTLPKDRDLLVFSSKDFFNLRAKIENSFKTIDSQRLFNISI